MYFGLPYQVLQVAWGESVVRGRWGINLTLASTLSQTHYLRSAFKASLSG